MWPLPVPGPSRMRASKSTGHFDFREVAPNLKIAGPELRGVGMGAFPLTSRAADSPQVLPCKCELPGDPVWNRRRRRAASTRFSTRRLAVPFALGAFAPAKLKYACSSSVEPRVEKVRVSSIPSYAETTSTLSGSSAIAKTRAVSDGPVTALSCTATTHHPPTSANGSVRQWRPSHLT